MGAEGTKGNRLLIGLFAAGVVAIAGSEVHRRYIPHRTLDEKERVQSQQKVKEQLEGGRDFNRASLDPEYVKKLSNERGFQQPEEPEKSDNGPKKDRVSNVKGKWWQVVKWLSQK